METLIVLFLGFICFVIPYGKDIYEYLFNKNRCLSSKTWHKSHKYELYRKPLSWGDLTYNINLMSSGITGRSYIWRKIDSPIIGYKCKYCGNIEKL